MLLAPVPDRPLILGHRGAAAVAPENTLAGISRGFRHGADAVEVDVRLSADGELYLMHDETPARTTDAVRVLGVAADEPGESLPWSVIERLDAGLWFDPEFAREPVPRLADLAALRGPDGLPRSFDIEIKPPAVHDPGAVVAALRAELAHPRWSEHRACGRLVLTSFDPEILEQAVGSLEVPIGLLVAAVPEGASEVRDLGLAGIVAEHDLVTEEAAQEVAAAGLPLWVYTPNTEADWERLLTLGVGGLCTDDPGALRAHLDSRG